MTLEEWCKSQSKTWLQVARMLSEMGYGPIYDNRLYRLRKGAKPDSSEIRALLELTNNEVESFETF